MKNYKHVVAFAMAATMMVGSGLTAMAAETGTTPSNGGATGTGDYEGYVEETSVFHVVVPTDASATKGFDFFVDPNGLLAATEYARITGATEADFESGASLFFTRTPDADATPAVVKYGKDSEAITFTNKSSYEVDVEVSATVSGADKITLGDVADDTTDPTIQLAIVSGEDTPTEAKITADGGKLTGTIGGADDNFEIQWDADAEKYVYAEVETPDETKWQTYSFHLTGACGGTWTADQAEVQPTVALTWKVTDPKATPADDYVMIVAENGVISYTFNAKPTGEVTALTINGTDRLAAYTGGNITYNSETGVFSVNATAAGKTGLADGGTVVVTIGGTDYTLTYTK